MIYDPMEQALPRQGAVAFTDGTGREVLDTAVKEFRQEFSLLFKQRVTHVRRELLKLGVDLNLLATHDDALTALSRWFRSNARSVAPANRHLPDDAHSREASTTLDQETAR